ncbi:unnamed protein product, partial [Sphacelaria rigidula]
MTRGTRARWAAPWPFLERVIARCGKINRVSTRVIARCGKIERANTRVIAGGELLESRSQQSDEKTIMMSSSTVLNLSSSGPYACLHMYKRRASKRTSVVFHVANH